jgi:hypothetical protein
MSLKGFAQETMSTKPSTPKVLMLAQCSERIA